MRGENRAGLGRARWGGVLPPHDGRPFHCIYGRAHRWGLVQRLFAVVIDGSLLDKGKWTEERCKRCVELRPIMMFP